MCKGLKMNVLVMDVEGTDGRERGEDQDFERKSALFSMASAEVLIVNLWEHQVGLYQGANMGLLKTVFEVNLGLFQASKAKTAGAKDKTLLLFVIRDHIGVTPLENLSATIMADLTKIWLSLAKPEGLEASQITDFFDFMFTTLPHKVLQPAEFDKAVDALRTRFVDPKDPNFVFKTEYHKRIPADGLPHYLESIWEQVMTTNKDLDLPTQQELLAQFRCDEIANAAFALFATSIKDFRKHIEGGSILDTLGADMALHRSTALASFDRDASRYHQEVYKRKRVDLLEKLNSSLSPFFLGQLKNLHRHMLQNFKRSVLDRMRTEPNYDFGLVVSSEKRTALAKFSAAANAVLLADTDWAVDEEVAQLDAEIQAISDTMRVGDQEDGGADRAHVQEEHWRAGRDGAQRARAEMWDQVLVAFRRTLEQAEATYVRKAKSFNCTEEENTAALAALRRKSWLSLRAKVDEQTADSVLAARLRGCFEDRFRYDDAGTPRVWKPEDDMDGAFRKARDETLALIPLYARIEPKDPAVAVQLASTEGRR